MQLKSVIEEELAIKCINYGSQCKLYMKVQVLYPKTTNLQNDGL